MHLGQVVVVRDDFYILDFEGEPLRPMDERRAKSSPLQGRRRHDAVLRLCGASTALHRRPKCARRAPKSCARRWPTWQHRVVERFLDGYRTALAGCPSVPAADEAPSGLLDLFLLEKVLYEIRYEATNRPDWLGIPAQGVQRALAAAG